MLLSFQRPPRLCVGGFLRVSAAREPSAPERAVEYSAPALGWTAPARRGRSTPPRRETSHGPRSGAELQQGPRGVAAQARSREAPELALADLQHARRRGRPPGRRAARPAAARRRACTPPCGERAPRLRARAAERVGDQLRAGGTRRRWPASTTSSMSSGSSRATNTRSKRRLGRRGRVRRRGSGPRARARARAWRRAAPRPPAAASPEQQRRTSSAIAASGIDSVLPYISSGGSVIPIVVAERLRHLLRRRRCPVSSGIGQHHLRRLAVGGLDRAAHQQVEGLVGAAELDVGAAPPPSRSPGAPGRAARAARSARAAAKRLAKSSRSSSCATVTSRTSRNSVLHRHVEPLGVAADLEPLVGAQHLAPPAPRTCARCASISSPESTGRVAERPLGSPTRAV